MSEESDRDRPGIDKVTIRPMEIGDLGPVFELGERLFTYKKTPNMYRTWDEYEVLSAFQNDQDLCLVAESDGEVIGFLLGTTIEKNERGRNYGYLLWLAVDHDFMRHGVGARLFRRFRREIDSRGLEWLLVDTEAGNKQGLAFFERQGFGDPEEHIYLSMRLKKHKPNGKAKNGKTKT